MQGAIGNRADGTAPVYKKSESGRRFRHKEILVCLEAEVSAMGREKKARKQFSDVERHITVKY